jgi:protein phosphatase
MLFIVADGMGGHRGGEIASKLAVDTVIASFYASDEKTPVAAFKKAFSEANRVIIEKSREDVALFGMGTTCTALAIRPGEAYFAHVGDSRAYILRGGELKQVTEDHSLVGEMVRSGIISDEDAKVHPRRNVITRSLGTHEELETDTPDSPLPLIDGDVFLLCSDGLTSLVDEEELEVVVGANSPREACDRLVELANAKGGKDNITVQVIKVIDKS